MPGMQGQAGRPDRRARAQRALGCLGRRTANAWRDRAAQAPSRTSAQDRSGRLGGHPGKRGGHEKPASRACAKWDEAPTRTGDSLGRLSGGELRCLLMVPWPTGRPRGDGSWPVRGPRTVNRAGSRAGADTAGDRSETARGGSLKVTAAHAAAPVSQPSRSYNGFTCRRRLAVAGCAEGVGRRWLSPLRQLLLGLPIPGRMCCWRPSCTYRARGRVSCRARGWRGRSMRGWRGG